MAKCKNCKEKFEPRFSSMEKYCWKQECKIIEAMQIVDKQKEQKIKQWNKKKVTLKKSLLTTSDYLKIAQQAFNGYIRLRDKGQMCISCDKKPLKENAGHYFSAGGHSNLRFDEDNVHLQCEHCNTFLSGNLLNYQIGIEKRIGGERLLMLHEKAHDIKKWSKEELEEITKKYKEKCKKLKM